jgi:hypothetical protein
MDGVAAKHKRQNLLSQLKLSITNRLFKINHALLTYSPISTSANFYLLFLILEFSQMLQFGFRGVTVVTDLESEQGSLYN